MLIKAAKYLGVPPWELMEQPSIWETWAIEAQKAEGKAERARSERQQRQSKRG